MIHTLFQLKLKDDVYEISIIFILVWPVTSDMLTAAIKFDYHLLFH